MRGWRLVLGALALWSGWFIGGSGAAQTAGAQAADEFAWGVIVDTTDPRGMRLAREAGFTHAKMIVHWPRLETSRGRFAWKDTLENDLDNVMKVARGEGMRLVVRVDGVPDWAGGSPATVDPDVVAGFYEAMAEHGKGVVAGYEILNEPNLPIEWGGPPSPSGYAAFLQAAYRGVKKADPSAVVIGGGVSPNTGGLGGTIEDVDFLRGMYAAGARGSMDALSVHNYGGNTEPERDPATCGICYRRAELYRQVMVEQGDAATSVWSTEFGWLLDPGHDMGQYDWMKVSAEQQAEYIVRAFRYGRANWPWLGGLLLSNLDASTSPYHTGPQDGLPWFAILNADYSPRPAYGAFKVMREQEIAARRPTPTPSASAPQAPEPPAIAAEPPAAVPAPSTSSAPPESVAAPAPGPSPAAAAIPVAAAAPSAGASVERVRVTGTDGAGVVLRAGPSTTARRVKLLPEGTTLGVIGADRAAEGRVWRNVREPGGSSGWVAADYVVSGS